MRIRVACHVHSDWSYDGKWSLPEIAEAFSKRGYRAVMLTEHDQGFDETRRLEHRKACQQASTEKILLVPGIEYSDASNTLHFLVWDNVSFLGTGLIAEQILAATQAAGAVVVLAHPNRREAWKCFEPDWAGKLLGIEVWNRKTDGWAPSRNAWQLVQGTQMLPFVGMDFHECRQLFPLATVIEAESPITEASILTAMRAGRCRSEAFGFPVKRFLHGISARPVRMAEFFRRKAAPVARKILR
jgi:predicted metal-dependent phosphoesterase TrpH